jgi:hypothetical protein
VKLIALEEAFWYDKLATDGTPDALIPVKPEVIAGWRRRLPDFTELPPRTCAMRGAAADR